MIRAYGPVADDLIECTYGPPAPPPASSYPTHEFPSVGTGAVRVTFRYSGANDDWQQWTDRENIKLDASMEPTLDSFVDNVSYFSREFGDTGYGNISWIGDIGGSPGGPPKSTYHNVGKALDVTWIQWVGGNSCRPWVAESDVLDSQGNGRPTTHRRLVAVEAGLRKWFGYVLNREIDNHANHFHVDNGCPVALRVRSESNSWKHTSCHYFLQDCINAFTDETVEYDGAWGDESKRGYRRLLSDLGMECLDPVHYINHYLIFLDFIMMHGFGNVSAGAYRWGDNAILS